MKYQNANTAKTISGAAQEKTARLHLKDECGRTVASKHGKKSLSPSVAAALKKNSAAKIPSKEKLLDQYYTSPEMAVWATGRFVEVETVRGHDPRTFLLIMPSAGKGAFLDAAESFGLQVVAAIDIDPADPKGRVKQANFLNGWTPPVFDAGRPVVFIDNVPFGRQGMLAADFLNMAATIGDLFAFIVPGGFGSGNTLKRLDKHLHLVHDEAVPPDAFIFEGKTTDVNCRLQIWERRDEVRADPEPERKESPLFENVKDRGGAVVAIRSKGADAGKVILGKAALAKYRGQRGKALCPTSNYKIKPSDGIDVDEFKAMLVGIETGLMAATKARGLVMGYLKKSTLVEMVEAGWAAYCSAKATVVTPVATAIVVTPVVEVAVETVAETVIEKTGAESMTAANDDHINVAANDAFVAVENDRNAVVAAEFIHTLDFADVPIKDEKRRQGQRQNHRHARIRAGRLADGQWIAAYSLTWKIAEIAVGSIPLIADVCDAYPTLVEAVEAAADLMLAQADEAAPHCSDGLAGLSSFAVFRDEAVTQAALWIDPNAEPEPDFVVETDGENYHARVAGFRFKGGWVSSHTAELHGVKSKIRFTERTRVHRTLGEAVLWSSDIMLRRIDEGLGAHDQRTAASKDALTALRHWTKLSCHEACIMKGGDAPLAGLKMVGLFSGIGGLEMGFEELGAELVMACERDPKARETFIANHPWLPAAMFPDDVVQLAKNPSLVPEHDILTFGWPCQGNSIAGHKEGLKDDRSGLVKDTLKIIAATRSKFLYGENVLHLLGINGGEDIQWLHDQLAELGYAVAHKTLLATEFGSAQARDRVFICGIRHDVFAKLGKRIPMPVGDRSMASAIADILDPNAEAGTPTQIRLGQSDGIPKIHANGTMVLGYLGHYTRPRDQSARVYATKAAGPTLLKSQDCRFMIGDYTVVGVAPDGKQIVTGEVRKLTARECCRGQDLHESFEPHESIRVARGQLGNAVNAKVSRAVAWSLGDALKMAA